MTCEECGDIGHSGNNCSTIQDVNYINNSNSYHPQPNQGWNQQNQDGISNNKGQTTNATSKVTFKVIISVITISHP
jgi:hypothetical protein